MTTAWALSRRKRLFDLAVATVLMVLTGPVVLVAAVVVRLRMGRPVLFRHVRAGKDATPFTVLKLRTMTDARGSDGLLAPDGERLTRLGRALRAASIDELPQLVNVVRGEMSLVGPRPLPLAYVERYDAHQRRRLDVRPGLTGWAQIAGRNAVDWPQRLALDVEYVDGASFAMDVRILLATLRLVLTHRGVSAPGHATMGEFRGGESSPSTAHRCR